MGSSNAARAGSNALAASRTWLMSEAEGRLLLLPWNPLTPSAMWPIGRMVDNTETALRSSKPRARACLRASRAAQLHIRTAH